MIIVGGTTIFIDANQYLKLYTVKDTHKLLEFLLEQQQYIFVTKQVVDEVQRNKLEVVASYLNDQFNRVKLPQLPDYAFDSSTAKESRKKVQEFKKFTESLAKAGVELLAKISRSEDYVSKSLSKLFEKAVEPDNDLLEKARKRREKGNSPGKVNNPLGDQLSWEQWLSHSKDRSKFWLISHDSDFSSRQKGTDQLFLNPLLFNDLVTTCKNFKDVFCFDNILDGMNHFVKEMHIKPKKVPSLEQMDEIRKDLASSSPDTSFLSSKNAGLSIAWLSPNIPWLSPNIDQATAFYRAIGMGRQDAQDPINSTLDAIYGLDPKKLAPLNKPFVFLPPIFRAQTFDG